MQLQAIIVTGLDTQFFNKSRYYFIEALLTCLFCFFLFLHFCMQPKAMTTMKNFPEPSHVTRPPCNHIYNARFFL